MAPRAGEKPQKEQKVKNGGWTASHTVALTLGLVALVILGGGGLIYWNGCRASQQIKVTGLDPAGGKMIKSGVCTVNFDVQTGRRFTITQLSNPANVITVEPGGIIKPITIPAANLYGSAKVEMEVNVYGDDGSICLHKQLRKDYGDKDVVYTATISDSRDNTRLN